ncbi:hypothetical protein BJ508DRAFT_302984 [Ascobolus immersus RN42]|uniref:Uncharacterized protein n=1 Tax=Ascobolus immersus RN42 TaxID=1160509 RepID=A0A3N4IIR0_ASCIM|nr:hypothetical protein BJ508DRAFT_302984 [Ascobolus immersus RN42]
MGDHDTDPTAPPTSAIAEKGTTSPSQSRAPSMEPPVHDDFSIHDDPSAHGDVSDNDQEDDQHSDAEDEPFEQRDEAAQTEEDTPRVVEGGEESHTPDFKISVSSAARIPLNESEQTDYSELSDSSVDDNVSLSGGHGGYGSEPEADHDADEQEEHHRLEEEVEQEQHNVVEEEEQANDSDHELENRPADEEKPETPQQAHLSDAFVTPYPVNKHLSIGSTPGIASLFDTPTQETPKTPALADTTDINAIISAPSSIAKLAALQSALAEKEKRIRHLEDMLEGDGPNDYATFTPEKRLKTTYTDSPGSRPRVQHTPQPSLPQPPVQSTPVPVRSSTAPTPLRPRSPIRLLTNIIENMAHGIDIPSPPTKEERKADKRRRMTREFRDFSAQGLPGLKRKNPDVAPVVEEEEEEANPMEKEQQPQQVESAEASNVIEEVQKVQEGPVVKEEKLEESVVTPAPEPTTEAPVEETIQAPEEIPSIPSTVFDPRRRRATSAPLDGEESKHNEDESFPDVNFFRRDFHTIKALQARVEELETELSNTQIALKIATSALTAERRARMDAEETRIFMEIERKVGACCHAQEEVGKLQSQLVLQREQEARKLEEVSNKIAAEREERAREREQWEQEKARMERQHARQLERATGSKKRETPSVSAPTRAGTSSRPASASSYYEAPSRKVMQQSQEDSSVRAPRKRVAADASATAATTASSRARAGTASSQSRSATTAATGATRPTAASRERKALNPSTGNVLLNSQGGQAMRKGVLGPKGGGGIEKMGGPIRAARMAKR